LPRNTCHSRKMHGGMRLDFRESEQGETGAEGRFGRTAVPHTIRVRVRGQGPGGRDSVHEARPREAGRLLRLGKRMQRTKRMHRIRSVPGGRLWRGGPSFFVGPPPHPRLELNPISDLRCLTADRRPQTADRRPPTADRRPLTAGAAPSASGSSPPSCESARARRGWCRAGAARGHLTPASWAARASPPGTPLPLR
jgi:hypothetical protein